MSDDLISRKAVIEAVDRHIRDDESLDEDITVILEEVKTAFNKEKVIEQLKNCAYWKRPIVVDDDESEVIDLDKAIEIVEKGGTE